MEKLKHWQHGDKRIKEKTELDAEVSKLTILKQSFLSQKYELEDKILKYYPNEIQYLKNKVKSLELDNQRANENKGFSRMTIKNIDYTEKKEAGLALLNVCKSKRNKDDEVIGEYKGFKLELQFNRFYNKFILDIKNWASHTIELGDDAFRKYSKNR